MQGRTDRGQNTMRKILLFIVIGAGLYYAHQHGMTEKPLAAAMEGYRKTAQFMETTWQEFQDWYNPDETIISNFQKKKR